MSSQDCFKVAETIHAASIRLLRIVRVEDAKSGIGPAQLSALSVLVFAGPRTLTELADAEQVRPPTMSRIVDGLVRQKLAQRKTDTADRRSLRIAATPKGRKLLLAGRDRRVQALAKRLGRLNEGELAILEKAAQLLTMI
jgi:DNA-binding MarR family transcriptional regulator